MAIPRVFISSTCYDLGEVRDGLLSFIQSYGLNPVLSEKGDVFFHPDLHTHESCLHEVENCDIFILIIGGRFGGTYVADQKRSIVNAEYESAKKFNIPVFTYIKRGVYSDHHVYEKNKSNKTVSKTIKYPSIESQKYSTPIFEFINQVRRASINNGITEFECGKDIQNHLCKQWAGMLFEYLAERQKQKGIEVTNKLIDNLSMAVKKSEELLKKIYQQYDENVEEVVENIDEIVRSERFLTTIYRIFKSDFKNISTLFTRHHEKLPENWWEIISIDPDLRYSFHFLSIDGVKILSIINNSGEAEWTVYKIPNIQYQEYQMNYNFFKKLSLLEKTTIITKTIIEYKNS